MSGARQRIDASLPNRSRQARLVIARLAFCCSLIAPLAFAQSEDFELPVFQRDAGVSAPTPPPLTPAPAIPSLPQPPTAPPPADDVSSLPEGPAQPPRWDRGSFSVEGVLAGLRNLYAGLEIFAGFVLGSPEVTSEDPKLRRRDVRGWVVVPGVDVIWGRLSGPVCGGSDFCGQRWGGAGAVRVGHALGAARNDGTVRLTRLFFGQLAVQGIFVNVPPAPLTQGTRWGELVLRTSGGLQLNTAGPKLTGQRGLVAHFSVFFEYLFFSPVGDGPQVGITLGVGF